MQKQVNIDAINVLAKLANDTEVSDEGAEVLLSAMHYLRSGDFNQTRRLVRKQPPVSVQRSPADGVPLGIF